MIGGHDIVIPTAAGTTALECSMRAVRSIWPDARFQNAESNAPAQMFHQVDFGELREVLAYRDDESSALLAQGGATPESANTMVHLIVDDGELTVVVDDPQHSQISQMLASIRDSLRALSVPVLLEAA